MNIVQKSVRRTRRNDEWFHTKRRIQMNEKEEMKTPPKFFILPCKNGNYFVFVKVSLKEWTPIIKVESKEEAEELIEVLNKIKSMP